MWLRGRSGGRIGEDGEAYLQCRPNIELDVATDDDDNDDYYY